MSGGIILPGTATASDVRSGKTFSSSSGFNITGTKGLMLPSGVFGIFPSSGGTANPMQNMVSLGNDLYYTVSNLATIYKVDITTLSVSTFTNPHGLMLGSCVGPDGNIWFTSPGTTAGNGYIVKMTPAGVFTSYQIPTVSYPYATRIVAGPDGRLWFSLSFFGTYYGAVTTSGVFSMYTSSSNSFSQNGNLAVDGTYIYFTGGTLASVYAIDMSGSIAYTYPVSSSFSSQGGMVYDNAGYVWGRGSSYLHKFTPGSSTVTTVSSSLTTAYQQTSGVLANDGNIYFSYMSNTTPYPTNVEKLVPSTSTITLEGMTGATNNSVGYSSYNLTCLGSDGNIYFGLPILSSIGVLALS
jgi:streptogramin lyase